MKVYELSPKTEGILGKAFQSHPPAQDQTMRMEKVSDRIAQAARFLCTVTPECAEQTLMIRCLQEARHWAQESILKNE